MYAQNNNLFEQSGIGNYGHPGDWSWQFYPPPYDFLAPPDSVAMLPPIAPNAGWGLSGCGGGSCSCGGTCGGSHSHGVGLFDSMDFSTWGVGEWALVAVGVYLIASALGDTKRAAKKVRGVRSRYKKRAALKRQLAST